MLQIHRRQENDRYIYTTAFVAHQFYRTQDYLTDTFLNVLSSFQTTISREHKDRLVAQRIDQQNALKTAVDDLDKSVFGLIRQIRELADNITLSDTQKIVEIKSALSQQKASTFEKLKDDLIDAREAAPLSEWFPQRHDVPLAQVLETINNHSGMLNAFEHWQQTHSRQTVSRPALLAGIMGLGCGIGVRKMARISSRITESELEHAVNWRFSLDNIRAANDAVIEAMD